MITDPILPLNEMTHALVERHKHRLKKAGRKGGVKSWSLERWMGACCGELGEAWNVMKKMWRIEDGMAGNKKTDSNLDKLRRKLEDEIVDALCYLLYAAAYLGMDIEKAFIAKYNTVSKRAKDPYHISKSGSLIKEDLVEEWLAKQSKRRTRKKNSSKH